MIEDICAMFNDKYEYIYFRVIGNDGLYYIEYNNWVVVRTCPTGMFKECANIGERYWLEGYKDDGAYLTYEEVIDRFKLGGIFKGGVL